MSNKTVDVATRYKMMKFSVVIPLYNKVQSVSRTIKSVLSQTHHDFELIVVDDGSTDGSLDIVRKFNDERIRLVQKENGGVSSARNYGLKEAKADYVAFLDADDVWEPFFLEEQAKMIHDFPEANMWALAWGYMKNGEKIYLQHNPHNYRGYVDDYWAMRKGTNIFFVCVCVFRRMALLNMGGYDERMSYGEDIDVAYRMLLNGRAAFNSKVYGMYYVQDAENRAMNKTIPLERFMPYYIEKYASYRAENITFRRCFDRLMIGMLYSYRLNGEYKEAVHRIVGQLVLREQPLTWRMRIYTPHLFWLLERCMGWWKS